MNFCFWIKKYTIKQKEIRFLRKQRCEKIFIEIRVQKSNFQKLPILNKEGYFYYYFTIYLVFTVYKRLPYYFNLVTCNIVRFYIDSYVKKYKHLFWSLFQPMFHFYLLLNRYLAYRMRFFININP